MIQRYPQNGDLTSSKSPANASPDSSLSTTTPALQAPAAASSLPTKVSCLSNVKKSGTNQSGNGSKWDGSRWDDLSKKDSTHQSVGSTPKTRKMHSYCNGSFPSWADIWT